MLGKLDSDTYENEMRTLPNTIHKKKLKMDLRRRCEAGQYKALSGEQTELYLTELTQDLF